MARSLFGMIRAMRRAAVIDMGSNSFRLVVFGYEPGRYWQHVDEIREAVRVGAGVGDDGMLQPEPRRAQRTRVARARARGGPSRGAGAVRGGGGALRLPGDRELDDDRGRL